MSNNKNILYCSFCGKSQHEVRKLIAGPTVFICDECVELCMDIIKEENKDSFVNFWKTEGYDTMHGPVVYESSLYNYFKHSCENNLCPTSFSSVPYDDFNSYLPMLAEGSKPYHWATFVFNE